MESHFSVACESGGPYLPDDPTPPATKAWTHRYRAEGRSDYELFDEIC